MPVDIEKRLFKQNRDLSFSRVAQITDEFVKVQMPMKTGKDKQYVEILLSQTEDR